MDRYGDNDIDAGVEFAGGEVGAEELPEVLCGLPLTMIFEPMDKWTARFVEVEHCGCLLDKRLHGAGVECHSIVVVTPKIGVGDSRETLGADMMVACRIKWLATYQAVWRVDKS